MGKSTMWFSEIKQRSAEEVFTLLRLLKIENSCNLYAFIKTCLTLCY